MANVMLTTLSNPFNPFTQFDEWYDYDVTSVFTYLVYSKKLNIRTQINPFQIKVRLIEPTCHESLFAECDLQYIT